MAVPKKKTSRSRRNSRKASWNHSIAKNILFAISIGKSTLKGTSSSFVFNSDID